MCMLEKEEKNPKTEGEAPRISEEEILEKIFVILEREKQITAAEKIRILKKTGGLC